MSKKQVMKKIFEEKINQDRIYQKVLLKVEEEASMNRIGNKKMIYGILSSCAMVIVCAVIITNGKFGIDKAENKNQITATNDKYVGIEDLKEEKQSREVNINKIEEIGFAKIDAEIKTANNFINIPYYEVLSNLTIPKDFESEEYINSVYIKSDRTKKEYDKLFNYQKIYKNANNNRSITIEYSKENKPMKDYHFEGEKTSKINGFEIVIYQYENSYMTSFTYDNLNIDIETNDITQDELIVLLESIIKEKNNVSVEEKDTHINEHCTNLKLINCEMEDTDLSFEYSDVEADIKGNVVSIKNPKSGIITVDSVEEIITEDPVMECNGKIIIRNKK